MGLFPEPVTVVTQHILRCILLLQTVCHGSRLNKFSNEGRGPAHTRYFWVNPSNTKVHTHTHTHTHIGTHPHTHTHTHMHTRIHTLLQICWAREKDASSRDTKSGELMIFQRLLTD